MRTKTSISSAFAIFPGEHSCSPIFFLLLSFFMGSSKQCQDQCTDRHHRTTHGTIIIIMIDTKKLLNKPPLKQPRIAAYALLRAATVRIIRPEAISKRAAPPTQSAPELMAKSAIYIWANG